MSERQTIDNVLAAARDRIKRLEPEAAHRAMADGALLIDTRCAEDRRKTGVIPGSVHVPLSVLFWRLDPSSGYDDPALSDLARPVDSHVRPRLLVQHRRCDAGRPRVRERR